MIVSDTGWMHTDMGDPYGGLHRYSRLIVFMPDTPVSEQERFVESVRRFQNPGLPDRWTEASVDGTWALSTIWES